MRQLFRTTFSPSMAVSLLALAFAVGGTSYAAVHLGHGSVGSAEIKDHSVKPVDLKAAPAQPVLQPGETMRGYYAVATGTSDGSYLAEGITYPAKLPANFNNKHVEYLPVVKEMKGLAFTQHCPGPGTAARGWLCFYEGESKNAEFFAAYDQNYNSDATADFGVRVFWTANDDAVVDGQWVVRAP